MMKENTKGNRANLSMRSAFSFFLKGNILFALNGIVVAAIDSIISIFPPLFQQVYTDNIITQKNPEWFMPLIVLYITLFVLEMVLWIAFSVVRRNSQSRLNITSSTDYLWTVLRLPMTRITQFSPGELVARYTTISKTIKLLDYSLPAVSGLLFPVIGCYLVMLFSWKLGVLQLFSVLLLLYVMRSTAQLQKKMAMNLEVTEARLQNVTMTGMSNLETIKSLGSEHCFFAQWEKVYAQSMNARVTTTTNSVYLNALPVVALEFTNAAILCLGTWLILQGELTPGIILAAQGLINRSVYPINRTIDSVQTFLRLTSSIQRIKDVADCKSETANLSIPEEEELSGGAKLAGEIELRDVTFGYDRSLPPILSHFSLKIKAGERIAFVGPRAAAKAPC